MKELVLLTREGCAGTPEMRANLDAALLKLGRARDYRIVDASTLAESDPWGGYGTPTLLYSGSDVFGLPEPLAPHGAPT